MTDRIHSLELLADVDVGTGHRRFERIPVRFEATIPVAEYLVEAGHFRRAWQGDEAAEPQTLLGHRGRAYEKVGSNGWDLTSEMGMPLPGKPATGFRAAPRRGLRVIEWGSADLKRRDLSAAAPRIERMQRIAAETLIYRGGRIYRRAAMPVWLADPDMHTVHLMKLDTIPRSGRPSSVFDPGRLEDALRLATGGGRLPAVYGAADGLDTRFDEDEGTRFARHLSEWATRWTGAEVARLSADTVRHWHEVRAAVAGLAGRDVAGSEAAVVEALRFVERIALGDDATDMRDYFARRLPEIVRRVVEIDRLPYAAAGETPVARP